MDDMLPFVVRTGLSKDSKRRLARRMTKVCSGTSKTPIPFLKKTCAVPLISARGLTLWPDYRPEMVAIWVYMLACVSKHLGNKRLRAVPAGMSTRGHQALQLTLPRVCQTDVLGDVLSSWIATTHTELKYAAGDGWDTLHVPAGDIVVFNSNTKHRISTKTTAARAKNTASRGLQHLIHLGIRTHGNPPQTLLDDINHGCGGTLAKGFHIAKSVRIATHLKPEYCEPHTLNAKQAGVLEKNENDIVLIPRASIPQIDASTMAEYHTQGYVAKLVDLVKDGISAE
jgi:hypothetical protein